MNATKSIECDNLRKKVTEYDVLRVVVTLLVIIGHCTYINIESSYGGCDYASYTLPRLSFIYRLVSYVTSAIYLFHMPLYMALSGALYRLKNSTGGGYSSYKSLITDKAKKLLLPFIVVTLFYSVPLKYISGYYSGSTNIFKDIIVGQVLVQGNTHLWFLPVLFVIFVVIYTLEKVLKIQRGWGIAFCLFIASYARGIIPISIVNNVLFFAFWFYFGYRFEDHRENINANLKKRPMIIISFIIVFLCSGLLRKSLSNQADTLPIYSILERCVRYICAMFGCSFVYSISYFLSKTNITEWRLFKVIRANTLGLYLYSDTWNYIILNAAVALLGSTVFITNIGSALLYFSRIAITFSIALVVSMILKMNKIKYMC